MMDVQKLSGLTDDQLRHLAHSLRRLLFPQPPCPSREHQDAVFVAASARLEIARRREETRLAELRRWQNLIK